MGVTKSVTTATAAPETNNNNNNNTPVASVQPVQRLLPRTNVVKRSFSNARGGGSGGGGGGSGGGIPIGWT